MATGIDIDLEVISAGAAFVVYSGSLVNLAIELNRGNTGSVEMEQIAQSAGRLTIALQRCGLMREIPTKFSDSATIVRSLGSNELATDIGNLIVQKHSHRQELLWNLTILLGTCFGAPGGREALGPQVTAVAKSIPVPSDVVNACLNDQSLQPLRTWVSADAEGRVGRKSVFIGHGRSSAWRDLKYLISDRLGLQYVEFNNISVAGIATKERLEQMLGMSSFAFLVMTAEDSHKDGSRHARENVIHEIGLFQGRLGFKRAIVLLENGCDEFSNLSGVGQIRFAKGKILAKSEEIRMVLEREGMLSS